MQYFSLFDIYGTKIVVSPKKKKTPFWSEEAKGIILAVKFGSSRLGTLLIGALPEIHEFQKNCTPSLNNSS